MVAAAGDVHARESRRQELIQGFADLDERVGLVLLAGDLTSHGTPDEARMLAEARAHTDAPVVAVLGNHDWHESLRDEIVEVLEEGEITVLDPGTATFDLAGVEVGIVGAKGFVGGFPGSHLPDFGEPLLRRVYAETSAEVDAVDAGLREIAHCQLRIVVLHYAPIAETLEGEPEGIYAFLGSDRLATPIVEHQPDLVVHGHAHAGSFRGAAGDVPVFNVSVEVTGKPFWVFELTAGTTATSPLH